MVLSKSRENKLLGILLGAVILLSVYFEFAQIANGVAQRDFVASLSIFSEPESGNDFEFEMGHVLVLSAVVNDCNVYVLRIYDKDALILEIDGCINGSKAEIRIPISPRVFGGGKVYKVVFHAGLLNCPVFGVNVYSSSMIAFTVVKGSSRLMLAACYDNEDHELRSDVRILSEESECLANKTVDFYLLPNTELQMRDRGWVHVGSRQTDENGTASFCLGVHMKSGNYSLKARYDGDVDFESSSNVTSFVSEDEVSSLRFVKIERRAEKVVVTLRIVDKYDFPLAGRLLSFDFLGSQRDSLSVISNETGYVVVSFAVDKALGFIDSKLRILGDEYTRSLQTVARLNLTGAPSFSKLNGNKNEWEKLDGEADSADPVDFAANSAPGIEVLGLGNVVASATPNPARADLPVVVKAKFSSYDDLYDGAKFCFYLNGTALKGTVTASVETVLVHYPDVYRYDYIAELIWQPDYWGNYSFLVKFLDAYNTVVAQGVTLFSVQPAPANMVVYYPEAFRGDSLNLTIAFSGPRTYEASSESDFFQTSRLAPLIVWNGVTYVLDGGVNATLIHVFVNGSWIADILSSSGTVSNALLPLNFSGSYTALNIRVATDDMSRYHEVVERNCSLTRVNILNTPSGGNDLFKLNYSLGVLNEGKPTYVDSDNRVEASVSVFGLPVDSVTAGFIGGKIEARSATNSSGWISIPPGYSLLRVKSACYLRDEMASPLADVNLDGVVNDIDLNEIRNNTGPVFGSSLYHWRFDLNADYRIDETDVSIVNCSLGKQIDYLDSGSYDYSSISVDFDAGTRLSLDSQGFAIIPSGAEWLNMSIGGIVEFFDFTLWKYRRTNNVGVTDTRWCPQQAGVYVLQVMLPRNFDVAMEFQSNVTHMDASLSLVDYLYVVKRPLDLNITYTPGEPTIDSCITLTARVLDLGLGVPVENQAVEFYVYKNRNVLMGTAYTSASGFATFSFVPRNYDDPNDPLYPDLVLPIICPETAETAKVSTYVHVDTRYRTKLELLGSEVMEVTVGRQCIFAFKLTRVDNNGPVNGRFISLYKDEDFPCQMRTNESGIAYCEVTFSESGTCFYKARFNSGGDWAYARSNEVKFIVVAQVVPVSILLDVQPRDFKPEALLTLSATVLKTTSNEPLQDFVVTFNLVRSDGSFSVLGETLTNAGGVASLPFFYPSTGAYAFNVSVAGCQRFICSPVLLTVAKETALTLDVSKGATDSNHTISGVLLSYGQPMPNRQVRISVNGTEESIVTTNSSSRYCLSLNFLPADNKPTTYSVQATFEGDESSNASAYDYTPNGTRYAACTATHYGYKPTSKSIMLTVEPRATQVLTQTKTPEQLQQEAMQNGSLTFWHEFTWWYPWYRLHIRASVNPTVHLAFNPILPGGDVAEWNGLEFYQSLRDEAIQLVMIEAFGLIATYLGAKYTSIGSFVAGIIVEAIKIGIQGFLLWPSWNNAEAMLASALVSMVMLIFAITDFGSTASNFLVRLIDGLKWVCGGAVGALTLVLVKLKDMFLWGRGAASWLVDAMEIGADFVLLVVAWRRCQELIHGA